MSTDDHTTTEQLTDRVEAALRGVRDPEADVDVFEAGLVSDLRVEDGRVTVATDLSTFPPERAQAVTATMVRAVSTVDGVDDAHVEQTTPDVETEGRSVGAAAADRVVAVASAKGGVGKSTVATTLACALAGAGEDVALFDADIYGPNVPELLSVEGPIHSDEDGNPVPVSVDATEEVEGATGRLEAMSVGLMNDRGPLAWRGAMAHDALTELYEETAWRDPDTLVVDLPPGTGDVALTTLQEVRVDGVVFVTTPFHAAVSDTRRSLDLFEENDVPVLGVVSNMGEFVCDCCGEGHDLFDGDDPVAALDVPVLAEVPFSGEMQGSPSPGAAPDAAREVARGVERRLDEVWSVELPETAVDLRGVPADRRRKVVREGYEAVRSGERFVVASDRDPTPVREFLRELVEGETLETFEVRRQNPETWLCRTVKP